MFYQSQDTAWQGYTARIGVHVVQIEHVTSLDIAPEESQVI